MSNYDDTATVSGSVVGFSNGADSVPLKNWLVTLPASLDGYTEVNGTKAGKNLIKLSADTASSAQRCSVTYTSSGAEVTAEGTYARSGCLYAVKTGVTYTISFTGNSTGDYNRVVLNDKEGWSSPFKYLNLTSTEAQYTWTFTASTDILFFGMYVTGGGTTGTMTISNLQLEVNSSASSYEPYTEPTSYTANLGQTVYGADADLVSGEGQENYGYIDLGSLNWVKVTSGQTPYFSTTTALSPSYKWASQNRNVLCNNYSYASIGSTGSAEGFFVTDGSYVRIRDANYESMTASEFKTTITGTILVYELATPTDFTFDPVTIETNKGSNTFGSEQGNTELTYYKDGYGFTSVTIHKETPEGEPVEETRKLHRIIYEGQVDVINGTGLIYRGESGTQYDPPEQISFTPIEIATDEGENTLYADEGDSAITYRKAVD